MLCDHGKSSIILDGIDNIAFRRLNKPFHLLFKVASPSGNFRHLIGANRVLVYVWIGSGYKYAAQAVCRFQAPLLHEFVELNCHTPFRIIGKEGV